MEDSLIQFKVPARVIYGFYTAKLSQLTKQREKKQREIENLTVEIEKTKKEATKIQEIAKKATPTKEDKEYLASLDLEA